MGLASKEGELEGEITVAHVAFNWEGHIFYTPMVGCDS